MSAAVRIAPQRLPHPHLVVVVAANPSHVDVAGGSQIRKHVGGRPFGQLQCLCNKADRVVRMTCDVDQDRCVIRQKRPAPTASRLGSCR